MKKITAYSNYKEYVQALLAARPRGGRGEYRKMAQFLKVHTTYVSQVFRGTKDLSLEQAAALGEFLGLSDDESEFFVTLVEAARAGTPRLARLFKKRLERARQAAVDTSRRLPHDRELTDTQRAVFYADWYYSGVRLVATLPGCGRIEPIAERLGLPRQHVANVIQFLVANGLLKEAEDGFAMSPQRTHLDTNSPFVRSHHRNWRLKAMARHETLGRDELAFTAPLTIARSDVAVVRAELQATIERVSATVAATEPDTLACLNIDWVTF